MLLLTYIVRIINQKGKAMKTWKRRVVTYAIIGLVIATGLFTTPRQQVYAQSGNYLYMHTESNCTSSPSTAALLVNQGVSISSFNASNNKFSCAKITWSGNINVSIFPNVSYTGTVFNIVRTTGSNPGEVISFLGNAIDNNSESIKFN